MEVIKDGGSFKVICVDEDVISVIADAARTCYQSQDKANYENDR